MDKGFIKYGVVLSVVFLLIVSVVLAKSVFATAVPKFDVCHYDGDSGTFKTLNLPQVAVNAHLSQHEQDYDGACEVVTPTPTPTGEPEVTPTPTPTVEPCDQDKVLTLNAVLDQEIDPCVTPTPTPTEEPTPTPTATPSAEPTSSNGDGSSTNAPSCSDAAINTAVANPHVFRKGDDARVVWFYDPNVSYRVAIYYGINGQGEQHSVIVDNKPGEYMIHGLGGGDYTFWVQFLNGCNSGPKSQAIVDGATSGWVLFR